MVIRNNSKCYILYLIVIVLLIICLFGVNAKSGQIHLPLKNSTGNSITFISSQSNVTIDVHGQITIDIAPIKIVSQEVVREYIQKEILQKVPNEIVDHDTNTNVTITFSSVIAFDGTNMYAKPDTELKADNYDTITLSDVNPNATEIRMQREKIRYSIELIGSQEVNNLKLLNDKLKIKVDNGFEIEMKKNRGKYEFEYGKGLDFSLTFVDKRFSPSKIPYNIWLPKGDGYIGEFQIKPKLDPFTLKIEFEGRESQKFSSVTLVRQRSRGNPIHDSVIGNELRIFQFAGLRWNDGPFEIITPTSAQYYCFDPIKIDFTSHHKKLDENLTLSIKQNVLSYIKKIGIQLLDYYTGKPKPGLSISLTDSENIPLEIQRYERVTDRNGEVLFKDVYDWQSAIIKIRQNEYRSVQIFKISDVDIKSVGVNRIDAVIRLY